MPEKDTWFVIVVALLGAIGTFWTKIKSTIEGIFKGNNEIALKKLESENTTNTKLKKRIAILEERNLRLTKSTVALSTAMMFIMDEYIKANPGNTVIIDRLYEMIKDNLSYDEPSEKEVAKS